MKKQFSDTKLSVLDLATVIQGHTPADSFQNSLRLAVTVERLGYERFWLAEHHNMPSVASSATAVLIGYIAAGTKTIRVGSGGIMLPNHAPLIVAEQFGTLEALFPGRIDLGLGRAPGTDQLTVRALRRDPMGGLSFPDDIRELQQYFSTDNANSPVRAIPGEGAEIPIWILGSSTDSAYLAAAMGLPYAFASHFAPAQLLQAIPIYRNNFKPSAVLQHPYVLSCINVVAADTDEEATFLSSSAKQLFLGIIRGQRQPMPPPVEKLEMTPSEEAALRQMTTYNFTGGPEKLAKELNSFVYATQADELMIVTHTYDQQARLRSYEILRQLQQTQ